MCSSFTWGAVSVHYLLQCGKTHSGVRGLCVKFIHIGGQLTYGITIDCLPSRGNQA